VSEIEEPVSVLPALDAILAQRPLWLALIDSPNKQRVTGQFPRQPTYAKADHEISALAAHFAPPASWRSAATASRRRICRNDPSGWGRARH
jgi:hypothetical protein